MSTNALELGIDIGRLDAAILAGYPGTIAGDLAADGPRRAGARSVSVAILVAGAGAVDQFVATHPEYLFDALAGGGAPRPRRTCTSCWRTSARRRSSCPSTRAMRFGRADADDLLAFLAEEGHVRLADDDRWYWASENFPASEVSCGSARRRTS